ncbi:hydroxymethylglutaryl-CoA lyase [Sphingobium lactosutens]|uniref:hydroxymethylglutaryl-CoA lyase n=1 Tax=Sphingobium lactosutens TaxID=522773 RepID=UPI0015BAFECF|nr:hydroxymethylglutaryl-CoA lyase [Sphingobium lactosutens]NWK97455.1 hydroxymethylglutaryl-CoA lyase [Sphingobium lactosutens]
MKSAVELVEVGPRDGFQSITRFIPTDEKIALIGTMFASGVRRMEITSFVSPKAVPQLADAAAILAAVTELPGLDGQVLVPTARHAERALAAGATHLCAVLSVSEPHNRSNIRRSPLESVDDFHQIVAMVPKGVKLRLNVATAFDCPYAGRVEAGEVLTLLERLLARTEDVEIALCDTTGRADPCQVADLLASGMKNFRPARGWAFHGHDTYGLGAANVLSAWQTGVRVFDASIAGLGGCPFAPGATGNVATEDLVWMFMGMGVDTAIDLDALVRAAAMAGRLPGAQIGGRVRDALSAKARAMEAA